MPRLSIGMPLYNNARTVRRAIDSLIAQSEQDWELVISDDGSTDGTRDVIAEYARRESRIRYHFQERNLNYGNFRFLLEEARSPFFMFAPGDDWWEPRFTASCIDALEENPNAVGAICAVMFHPESAPSYMSVDTHEISGDVRSRLLRYLSGPGDNSRMYSVFRTDVARRSFPRSDYHAYDWAFSATTLFYGDHIVLPQVGMHREATPPDRYVYYVRRDNRRWFDRLFPLAPLTRHLLADSRLPRRPGILRALMELNRLHHLEYVQAYHPTLRRAYAWLGGATN